MSTHFSSPPLESDDFEFFKTLFFKYTGIQLNDNRKTLVVNRLNKRLRLCKLPSYHDYLLYMEKNPDEIQAFVDAITTNETSFFRENQHFEYLSSVVNSMVNPSQTLKVWSAACSIGAEPYTLAMVLKKHLASGLFEILASDINRTVLDIAKTGIYPLEMSEKIAQDYLKLFCLKGYADQSGKFAVKKILRKHIKFEAINLNEHLPSIGMFDVVFLRNMLIYFDNKKKEEIVCRIGEKIKSGGLLFVGSSETLNWFNVPFEQINPSVYRKIT